MIILMEVLVGSVTAGVITLIVMAVSLNDIKKSFAALLEQATEEKSGDRN